MSFNSKSETSNLLLLEQQFSPQQSFVLSFKQTTKSFCCRSANLIVEIVKRNIFYTRVNHKLFQRLTVEGSTLQEL